VGSRPAPVHGSFAIDQRNRNTVTSDEWYLMLGRSLVWFWFYLDPVVKSKTMLKL
jgi:hypothetical protein